ncbi:MAG: hypothetical protein ACOCX2_12325 [Armatimonadota bacterium]
MRWDDDMDDFDFEDEPQERATIAPTMDEVWDTLVLMRLEAGVLSDDDLPGLEWEDLPEMPEDMEPRDEAMHFALAAYEGWYDDPDSAEEMVRHATELDPYCIEAWVALWWMQDIDSYEALVTAGKAVLYGHQLLEGTADVRFVEDVWQYPRIRGAVRAFGALALTNWAHEMPEEAFEAAEEALRLAPNDEMGLASHLVNWYLATGDVEGAERVLRDLDDTSNAPLAYAEALVEFAQNGPEEARGALLAAVEAHPLFLGNFALAARGELERVDMSYPFHTYTPGTFEELAVWWDLIENAWLGVEGAFNWAVGCANEPEFDELVRSAAQQAATDMEALFGSLGIDVDSLSLDDFDLDDDEDDGPDLRLL